MKSLLTALMLLFAVLMSSCSNSLTGPGGIGNVTFTTRVVQDQQMNTYFQFVPSTGVTLDSLLATCPQLMVSNELVSGDGTTVYTAMSPFNVPVTGLAAAQQWTFVIAGKVGSATGTVYRTTVSYTQQ